MKVELTVREIRLLASALQKEVVRLAHREREAGRDKEYEALWNKFIHWEEGGVMTLKLALVELTLCAKITETPPPGLITEQWRRRDQNGHFDLPIRQLSVWTGDPGCQVGPPA